MAIKFRDTFMQAVELTGSQNSVAIPANYETDGYDPIEDISGRYTVKRMIVRFAVSEDDLPMRCPAALIRELIPGRLWCIAVPDIDKANLIANLASV